MATNKRDLLLATAERLFYTEGSHATGIDRILSESGVAKMTLYKHFKSKDELILAVLEARQLPMLERLRAREARGGCELGGGHGCAGSERRKEDSRDNQDPLLEGRRPRSSSILRSGVGRKKPAFDFCRPLLHFQYGYLRSGGDAD